MMTKSTNNFITIVSGLPRSGTSMMMRMLEVGGMPVLTDNIRKADIDNPNGYYEFEPVKQLRKDASWMTDAYGKAVKMVYALLYELPEDHEYRVILMKRNLEEVLASQDAMLRRNNKDTGTLDESQVVRMFQDQLQKVEVWLSGRENVASLNVEYNDVVADPATAVLRVDRFLGLSLDTAPMIKVLDPLLYRQRRLERKQSTLSQ
jgi:Sulfotransferase domain